jgi:NAD(P)-dependent dehydrogenase (short-subunit alcohol dehydrogenase family)
MIDAHKSMYRSDLLSGKRILITGGGTGLGKSIGQRYVELGANLVICGRRKEVLDQTAKESKTAWASALKPMCVMCVMPKRLRP